MRRIAPVWRALRADQPHDAGSILAPHAQLVAGPLPRDARPRGGSDAGAAIRVIVATVQRRKLDDSGRGLRVERRHVTGAASVCGDGRLDPDAGEQCETGVACAGGEACTSCTCDASAAAAAAKRKKPTTTTSTSTTSTSTKPSSTSTSTTTIKPS